MIMEETNYKDYPKSITEIKADITHDAATWTSRDVLIELLRRIDNGEKVSMLVCVYQTDGETGDEKDNSVHYSSCCLTKSQVLGMLVMGGNLILGE